MSSFPTRGKRKETSEARRNNKEYRTRTNINQKDIYFMSTHDSLCCLSSSQPTFGKDILGDFPDLLRKLRQLVPKIKEGLRAFNTIGERSEYNERNILIKAVITIKTANQQILLDTHIMKPVRRPFNEL